MLNRLVFLCGTQAGFAMIGPMNIEDYCVEAFNSRGVSFELGEPYSEDGSRVVTPFELVAESGTHSGEFTGPRDATVQDIAYCVFQDAQMYYSDPDESFNMCETPQQWEELKEEAEFVLTVLGEDKEAVFESSTR